MLNFVYNVLQASSRAMWLQHCSRDNEVRQDNYVADVPHLSTIECVAWPLVHDCKFEHTGFWCPELRKLPSFDLMREPWRMLGDSTNAGKWCWP